MTVSLIKVDRGSHFTNLQKATELEEIRIKVTSHRTLNILEGCNADTAIEKYNE